MDKKRNPPRGKQPRASDKKIQPPIPDKQRWENEGGLVPGVSPTVSDHPVKHISEQTTDRMENN